MSANNRLLTDATGDRIADALENLIPIQAPNYAATITAGQWSGSGSDYYITVQASNVTANSILIPHYDSVSLANLKGPVWCVPNAGSFTVHTSAIPSGTVTVVVQFVGVMGEAQYQVLADVYSTSQTYSKSEAVAKADIVNNLTSGGTTVPLSAEMGKKLGVHDLGTFSTLAALDTAIGNELSNLEVGQQADIKFGNSATFGLFVWTGTWVGTLQKNANTRGIIKCFNMSALPPKIIYGHYKDGTLVWNLSGATKGDITGAASTISEMFGYYVYSPNDRMVRIYISARSSSNITTSTVLGVIPSGYRPSSSAILVGAMGTGTGMAVYKGHVNTNGEIYQDIGNTLREIVLVGEYYM